MTGILKAESAYAKLNPAVVTISSRLTVADGGIDAEVQVSPDAHIPADCFFSAGLTGIQLKSGSSFAGPKADRGELINSAGTLFPEVARLTEKKAATSSSARATTSRLSNGMTPASTLSAFLNLRVWRTMAT